MPAHPFVKYSVVISSRYWESLRCLCFVVFTFFLWTKHMFIVSHQIVLSIDSNEVCHKVCYILELTWSGCWISIQFFFFGIRVFCTELPCKFIAYCEISSTFKMQTWMNPILVFLMSSASCHVKNWILSLKVSSWVSNFHKLMSFLEI